MYCSFTSGTQQRTEAFLTAMHVRCRDMHALVNVVLALTPCRSASAEFMGQLPCKRRCIDSCCLPDQSDGA